MQKNPNIQDNREKTNSYKEYLCNLYKEIDVY